MRANEIFQLIDANDAVAFLRSLVRIDSVNPPGKELAVAEVICGRLRDSGLEVELDVIAEQRANLFISLPRENMAASERVLVYTGHFDTVPIGSNWTHDPLGGERVGNKLYGRGTTDMKSGVAAMVLALEYLKRAGVRLAGKLLFVGTAGEEVDGFGAKEVVRKRQIDCATALVVGEPTGNQAVIAHKGALWLEVTTFGKTAHGSMPEQGVNAISAMNRFLNQLAEYRIACPPHPVLGEPTVNVATISGGVKTNMVPDQCTVTLDIRSVPPLRHEDIVAEIDGMVKQACDALGASHRIKVINDMAAVSTAGGDPFIETALQTARVHFGRTLQPGGVNYYTDASVYAPHLRGVPVLIYGPGEPTLAHQPDEWVDVEKYLEAIRFYIALALEYLRES